MRYKERLPRPAVCENCPEWSIKACWDCEHIRQRYDIDELDWLNESENLRLLRLFLEVEREEQYHVLRWKPHHIQPVEERDVLLLLVSPDLGHYCVPGFYRSGLFWFRESASPVEDEEDGTLIGWDYYPYDEHPNPKFENLIYEHLVSFGKDVREGKAQWPMPREIEEQPEV